MTKQTAKTRWGNHVRKAYANPDYNHGLYNAIRKYGPASFSVAVLAEAKSKQDAQKLERRFIAAADRTLLYNISPGGEADGETGGKVFWGRLKEDPEAKGVYLKKLSDAKTKADWSDYGSMSEAAKQWRKDNPKEAYKLAYRGIRLANKGVKRAQQDERTLKEKLMWKHKKGKVVSENTTKFWANCTAEKRDAISNKISAASKAQWAAVTDPEKRSELTSKARSSIDRSVQGKAASEGIKAFWAKLKQDPARYAAYMEARTASLMKTIERKR